MKVSVLMPSRGRPQLAKEAIESLGKGNFEVLVWLDKDDPLLDEYDLKAKVFAMPRVGYKNFHKMINFLCKKSTGNWLMLWNDDAYMDTDGWLKSVPQDTGPMVINFGGNPETNLFPLISRTMYNKMGHFSLSTHCDSWVQDIGNELDIHLMLPGVSVQHRRDSIHDTTKDETQRVYAVSSPLYLSEDMYSKRQKDINKLKEVLMK